MKITTTPVVLAVAALAAVGAGSFWLGQRHAASGHGVDAAATAASAAPARKLLFYRNPMGLPDTSPTPKKDSMGMDYIAVYEGEDDAADAGAAAPNGLRLSTEKVQKLGVRTEAASLRLLGRVVRASGRVEADERRIHVIAPRFEGFVEKLHVNVTGQPVSKGQPLFDVYSPELVSAQREYSIAMQGLQAMKDAGAQAQGGMQQLADASLLRLRNWELSPAQISALTKTGEPQRTVTFPSPVSGVVTAKKALQGMRFMPGEELYQVTDLSAVWVIADLAEQDIGQVKTGAMARISTTAYPNEVFQGRITYVYPTLNAQTRTVPVRVELANPGGRLKPAMFAQIELPVGGSRTVLAVPDSAVLDSGTRRIVIVQTAPGRFEPREVELGERGESGVEIRKGVREGEQVVVAANFLIDAESNLKAAVSGMGSAASAASASSVSAAAAAVGHRAEGSVDSVDAKAGILSLNHGAVASLKWPAMTMEFKAANPALLQGLKPGQAVSFEFVERGSGDWVVTAITPRDRGAATAPASASASASASAKASPPASASHSGH